MKPHSLLLLSCVKVLTKHVDDTSHCVTAESWQGTYEHVDDTSHCVIADSWQGIYEHVSDTSHCVTAKSWQGTYEHVDEPVTVSLLSPGRVLTNMSMTPVTVSLAHSLMKR